MIIEHIHIDAFGKLRDLDLDLLRTVFAGTLVLMHDDRLDELPHDLRR